MPGKVRKLKFIGKSLAENSIERNVVTYIHGFMQY